MMTAQSLALTALRGPGAPAFSPLDLPGLSSWWDISDPTCVTVLSDKVAGVTDKSPNGRDLDQTGISRPDLITVGGMDMASFDGIDDSLRVGTNAVHEFGSGDFMIAIVYRCGDTDRATLLNKGTGAKIFIRINDTDVSPTGKARFDINDGSSTATVLDSAKDYADDAVRLFTMRRDGNDLRAYENGVEMAASPTDITGFGDTDSTDDLELGIRLTNQQPMAGEVGEVVIVKGSITAADLARLHSYLNSKWGLS